MRLVAFIILLLLIAVYLYYRRKSEDVINLDTEKTVQTQRVLNSSRRIELHDGPYSVDLLQSNPKCLYLYEDNEDHTGYMRRAHIRDEPNSHPIITKHRQGSKDDDFYSDREADETALTMIEDSFRELVHVMSAKNYTSIIIPTDFGKENELHKRAPNLYKYLLNQMFDIARLYDPFSLEIDFGDWIRHSVGRLRRSNS